METVVKLASFCYVDDLVELDKIDEFGLQYADLGNPNEFTIKELAELVSEKHVDYKVKNEELPIDDPKGTLSRYFKSKNLYFTGIQRLS